MVARKIVLIVRLGAWQTPLVNHGFLRSMLRLQLHAYRFQEVMVHSRAQSVASLKERETAGL